MYVALMFVNTCVIAASIPHFLQPFGLFALAQSLGLPRQSCLRTLVHLQAADGTNPLPPKVVTRLVSTLVVLLKDTASDVRRSAAKAVKRFAKSCPGLAGRLIEVHINVLENTP